MINFIIHKIKKINKKKMNKNLYKIMNIVNNFFKWRKNITAKFREYKILEFLIKIKRR